MLNLPPLGWITLILSATAVVVSLSMLFLILWQVPRQRDNQLLAGYMFSVVFWGVNHVILRTVGEASSPFVEGATWGFVLNIHFLFAFVTYYLGLWNRLWVQILLASSGIVFVILSPILLIQGQIFESITVIEGGRSLELSTLGLALAGLAVLETLMVASILWHNRESRGHLLWFGGLLSAIATITIFLPVLRDLPIPMLTASVVSVMFARLTLQEQLFNPLIEMNRELAEREARYREMNTRLVASENKHRSLFEQLAESEARYRETAEQIAYKENLYRTLAKHLPNTTVVLYDDNLHYLLAEGQIEDSPWLAEIAGRSILDHLQPAEQLDMEDHYRRAIEGHPVNLQREVGERLYNLHIVPVLDENQIPFAGMIVSQDITDLKDAEEQLMQYAIEKERMKVFTDFIGDAAHDLKTPLTVINTSLHVLERSRDPLKKEQKIDTIKKQVDRLDAIMQTMFNMSRLDSDQGFHFEIDNINEVITRLSNHLKILTDTKSIELQLEFCDTLPPIEIDEASFGRVLTNLVENATKFTPEDGSITIRTKRCQDSVAVEVQDTGIGIDPKHLDLLFDRFYKVDDARAVSAGGVGLGLSIVQKIMDAHAGEIEVESVIGQGSTFRLLLPTELVYS